MPRWFRLFALLLIVPLLVAACGDDDDDSDGEPTATTTTSSSVASPTAPAGSGTTPAAATAALITPSRDTSAGSASPTTATQPATVEPTEQASESTSTSDASLATVGVPTEDVSEPTEAAATETVSPTVEPLLGVMLNEDDLPDGWSIDTAPEVVGVEDTNGEELCGTEGFPEEAQSLGQVSGQFTNDEALIVMLQKIWAYPDDLAQDAFAFWNDATDCGHWTEDDGTVFTVEPLDDPGLGEESFAAHLSFDAAEQGVAQGDYVFMRSGSLVMLIAYIGTEGADFAPLDDPIQTAADRLQEAAAQLESQQ